MKFGLSVLALILAPTVSFAGKGGSTVGDGGHGVVCNFSNETTTVELLDVYEARSYLKISAIDTPIMTEHSSIDDMILSLGVRFHQSVGDDVLPDTFVRALNLSHNLAFEPTLGPTQDAGFLPGDLPSNCSVEQIGVSLRASAFSAMLVNQSLWTRLSQAERALFLIHESLHQDGFETVVIRQLMSYIMASDSFQIRNRLVAQKILRTRSLVMWSEFQ